MNYLKKIQIISIFIFLSLTFTYGQTPVFKFDTPYFNAINKWVVFPMSERDSSYCYGYIFLDENDGFCFLSDWVLKLKGDSIIYNERNTKKGFSVTFLNQNYDFVAILTPKQLEVLGLEKGIDWLDLNFYQERYEKRKDSLSFIASTGSHLYENETYFEALKYLEKAYAINPNFKYIKIQLSISYYETKQYEKAIEILEKAILQDSLNFYVYHYLGLSYKELNDIEKAKNIFEQGYKITESNLRKSFFALEIAKLYSSNANKKEFNFWSKKVKKLDYEEHIEALKNLKTLSKKFNKNG